MPVPSTVSDLSTTPASNFPAGSESPSTIDDYLRAHAAIIKQVSDSNDATNVKLTGDQTVAGTKTFSSAIAGSTTTQVSRTTSTGSAIVPTGTEAQRDGSPLAGYFRFNTTLGKFEGYTGTAWGSVGGGATGGGADEVFVENAQTVTTNYTITAGRNAHSAGPITINDGVTVTVPDGSRWVIS